MQLKEQIQVRKDLLEIDKIRDECNYILDNDIKDINTAREKLVQLKDDIKIQKQRQRMLLLLMLHIMKTKSE